MITFVLFLSLKSVYADKTITSHMQSSLPSGPGSYEGLGKNILVTPNMGMAGYTVPLQLPKGHANHTPALNITYQSTQGNSILGMGWNIEIPLIQRSSRLQWPLYTDDDVFTTESSYDLKRIPSTHTWRERSEKTFTRYHKINNDGWKVEYAQGSTAYFGVDEHQTPTAYTQGSQGIFAWHVVDSLDTLGNKIHYHYFKHHEHTYISSITWAFVRNGQATYEAQFNYEERPDKVCQYMSGKEICLHKRLSSIAVFSRGRLYKKYVFSYTHSYYNDTVSLLSSIAVLGSDGTTPDFVHYTFQYPTQKTTFSQYTSSHVTVSRDPSHVHFIDINADTLPDIVDSYESTPKAYTAQASTCTHTTYPAFKTLRNDLLLSSPYVHMMDINGDGFTDVLNTQQAYVVWHTGTQGWSQKSPVTGFIPHIEPFIHQVHTMDYNGDKKIDFVVQAQNTLWFYESIGDGSFKQASPVYALDFPNNNTLQLADLNGDGLTDVVQYHDDGFVIYKPYMGYGVFGNTLEMYGLPQTYHNSTVYWADVNGDNLDDAVLHQADSLFVYLNNDGFSFSSTPLNSQDGTSVFLPSDTFPVLRIIDMNGNGSTDIAWITNQGQVGYIDFFNSRSYLLHEASNGIGEKISFNYTCALNSFKKNPSTNNVLLHPMHVLTQYTQTVSGIEPDIRTFSYQYEKPYFDLTNHRFNGFEYVTENHGTLEKNTHYNTGHMFEDHTGLVQEISLSLEKNLFSTVTNTYDNCKREDPHTLSNGWTYPCQTYSLKKLFNTSNKSTYTSTHSTYDFYGNVVSQTQHAENTHAVDMSSEYIAPAYFNHSWNIQKPYHTTHTYGSKSPQTRHTYYLYDGFNTTNQAQKGLLTETRINNTTVEKSTYDVYGNKTSTQDAENRLHSFTYNNEGLHQISETWVSPESNQSLTALFSYDPVLNTVVSYEDFKTSQPNTLAHKTTWHYNTLGRLTHVVKKPDTQSQPTETLQYSLNNGFIQITHTQHLHNKPNEVSFTCLDGHGRIFQTYHALSESLFQNTLAYVYTEHGIGSVIQPYTSWAPSCGTSPSQQPFKNHFFYDGLGRKIRQTDVFSITQQAQHTWSYDLLHTFYTNPLGNTQKTTYDHLGRTLEKQFLEKDSSLYAQYRMEYDGYGKISLFENPLGHIWSQEHSFLHHPISTHTPFTGTTSRIFDNTGLLTQEKDAQNNTTSYHYDFAGRILNQTQEGQHPYTQYTYTHNQLSDVSYLLKNIPSLYQHTHEHLTYNERSDLTSLNIHHPSHDIPITYSYDNAGKLLTTSVFNTLLETRSYDASGRLQSIQPWVTNIRYNTQNQIGSYTYANGNTTYHSYNIQGLMTSLRIENPRKQVILHLAWEYNLMGQVTVSQDLLTHKSPYNATHSYDTQNRLVESVYPKETVTYMYDKAGNILNKSSSLEDQSPAHTGKFVYNPTQGLPIKAGSWAIDHNHTGDITHIDNTHLTWDSQHRMTHAKVNNQKEAQWYYHPSNRMAYRLEEGHLDEHLSSSMVIKDGVLHLRGYLGDVLIGTLEWPLKQPFFLSSLKDIQKKWMEQKNIQETKMLLSQRSSHMFYDEEEPFVTTFYHTDRQGHPVLQTGMDGNVQAQTHYYPYGENQPLYGNMDFIGFSSLEKDSLVPFTYHHQRHYASSLGRFVSSDPYFETVSITYAEKPLETLSYMYAQNNPLNYTDREGLYAVKDIPLISKNVHGMAIQKTLRGRMPEHVLQKLVDIQKVIDKDQRNETQYQHAMRSDGYNTEQAAFLADLHIKKMITIAQKIPGDMRIFALGSAIHTAQDSTSPAHEGFQYWGKTTTLSQQIDHIDQENTYPSGMYQKRLEGATRWIYDIFEGRSEMPAHFFDMQNPSLPLMIPEQYLIKAKD
jgi:RHS repeat-associated protein